LVPDVLYLLRLQSHDSLQPSDADCVLVHGGIREDSDSVLLLRFATTDGSGGDGNSCSGGISLDTNRLRHELPLPKGPDDKSPDVIRRTVRMITISFLPSLLPSSSQSSSQEATVLNLSDIVAASSSSPRARPCVAEFVQSGNQVVCCVIKGHVHLLSTLTQEVLQSIVCPASSSLRQIRAGYTKDVLTHLLLQRDKSLQVVSLNPDDHSEDGTQEYEDPVNRIGWVDADLSRNCEYLGGALADPREHKLYVWDLSNSALVKVIDGPKEDVVAMRWHPYQPVLVSVSVSGKVRPGVVVSAL
jgi:WD40 repeat protein